MSRLTGVQIDAAGLDGWAYLLDGLQTRIATGSFAVGLQLVAAIGDAAEAANHHPDLDLRPGHLDVRLTSHDAGGVTDRDVDLARTITELGAAIGLHTSLTGLSRFELGLDSPAPGASAPFWAAVLGLAVTNGEVVDPAGKLPTVWYQESGSEEPRQRWHPDVWVDPSEVGPRIDAAVAAGGSLVSEAAAPSFWVLADQEGNRACLCTWQDRGR